MTAAAQTAEEPEIEEQSSAPVHVSVSLQTSVGQGSFVADEHARNAYAGYSLSLVPSYAPHEDWRLSLLAAVSQELTDADIDTEPQQLLLADTRLGARYAVGKIPVADIGVSAEGRLYLPTSMASQHQTLVLGSQLLASFSRAVGPVSFGLKGGFRKNFHQYESPVLEQRGQVLQSVLPRAGSDEVVDAGIVQAGSQNVSHSVLGELSVSYSPLKPLTFGIAYALSAGFTYRSVPLDEQSGVFAEEGVGQRDLSSGTLFASYQLDDRFAFGAGMSTVGSPRSADTKSFRFPFFDFESEADNLTTFYLDVTYTEAFGK